MPDLGIDAYWTDKPGTSVELSGSRRNVLRASRALERQSGEAEAVVTVSRPDGLMILSATTEGCVGTFRAEQDADWLQLVGDDRWDRADEVEVLLGGQLVMWPRRYFAPVALGRQIVEEFGTTGLPLIGSWEEPSDH